MSLFKPDSLHRFYKKKRMKAHKNTVYITIFFRCLFFFFSRLSGLCLCTWFEHIQYNPTPTFFSLSLSFSLFLLFSSPLRLMIFDYDEPTLSKQATCLLCCSNICALVFTLLIARLILEVIQSYSHLYVVIFFSF